MCGYLCVWKRIFRLFSLNWKLSFPQCIWLESVLQWQSRNRNSWKTHSLLLSDVSIKHTQAFIHFHYWILCLTCRYYHTIEHVYAQCKQTSAWSSKYETENLPVLNSTSLVRSFSPEWILHIHNAFSVCKACGAFVEILDDEVLMIVWDWVRFGAIFVVLTSNLVWKC